MLLRHAPYTLALRHPFGIASHTRTSTPATLTTFEHEGITGYGEAAMPPYLGESQATAAAFLDRAAAHLATVRDPFQLEEILPALDALAPGNTAAKAAVDLALHDWIGKKLGAPWHRIWGLDPAKAPVTSFTLGIDSPDVVRQKPARPPPSKSSRSNSAATTPPTAPSSPPSARSPTSRSPSTPTKAGKTATTPSA